MEIKKTGNPSLDKWINYFINKKQTNTRFIHLLKKIDRYFLTISPIEVTDVMFDEYRFPDDGLLEDAFREIAFSNNPKSSEQKTKIALAIYYQANMQPWMKKYGEIFFDVVEKSLIEGDYEKYDIEFEKILTIAVEKKYVLKNEFMSLALLRGMLWSSRYDTPEKKEKLDKEVRKNKLKIWLGI